MLTLLLQSEMDKQDPCENSALILDQLKMMLLSDVCLSVAFIGPKSRTERPRKTKIGTEVAHVTLTPLSRSKVNLLLMS